jgi:hypothetical protein
MKFMNPEGLGEANRSRLRRENSAKPIKQAKITLYYNEPDLLFIILTKIEQYYIHAGVKTRHNFRTGNLRMTVP